MYCLQKKHYHMTLLLFNGITLGQRNCITTSCNITLGYCRLTSWCPNCDNVMFFFCFEGHKILYNAVIWAPSSEFVSSNIPSWQILTAHAQPFRGARDLAFWLKVPLDSLPVWASSGGSGETARMRRLAWTFAARIGDKYPIRLTRSIW